MNGPKPHRSTKPTGEASTSARDGSAKGGQPGKPPADRRPRTPTPQPASSQSSPPVSQPAGNQPDASASKPTGDRLGPPAPKQPGDQPVPPAPKGAGNQPSPPPSEPANDQPDTAASKQVGVKDGSDVNEVQLSVRFTAHGGEEIATRFMTLSIPKNPEKGLQKWLKKLLTEWIDDYKSHQEKRCTFGFSYYELDAVWSDGREYFRNLHTRPDAELREQLLEIGEDRSHRLRVRLNVVKTKGATPKRSQSKNP